MPSTSNRGSSAPSSPIRKLVPFADQAKSRGTHVYHLNIGQPDIETPAVMRAALADYDQTVVAYGPSVGDKPFRDFLFGYYEQLGAPLKPNELCVTTGGSEAVLFAFAACLDAGHSLLVPDPMYANYLGYGALLGNPIVPLPTRVEDGYHLPETLDEYVVPGTKAVLLCNPSNPTGAVYSEAEIERLVRLCHDHDLFLIADEVYREFVYDGPTAPSVLTWPDMEQRAVVVDSLSKRFSLCGARIGCLVSRNAEVMAAALKFAQARLSPPALAQVLAAHGGSLGDAYFGAVKSEYRRRRDVVFDALAAMPGVFAHRPEGAFYQMARLPVDDSERFVRWMLEEFTHNGATTMMAPGAGFYAQPGAGTDEVRIAYVLNETDLAAAMECVAVALQQYPGRK